ncbi:YjgN family protein [Thiohalomonas denitrificans]|uniref:YjgN family protein n=1 Tax=Thiohalomonas denitrificans TaxID=415747 RepID=UPI0026E9F9B5|nr:YjgN family protein [Thiohalomonas denitrificans]
MTDAQNYEIVFSGEILDGFEAQSVKERIAAIFDLTGEKLEALFSHPQVVLRRNLNADKAEEYRVLLENAGLKTNVRRSAPAPAASSVGAVPAEPVSPERDVVVDRESSNEPFTFAGTGAEFFRIWIVNIALTIVTIGIYSAWAKVRTQRYFYGNTRLHGSSFEYLAEPLQILKGRLIGLALFALIAVGGEVAPVVGVIGTLLLFVLMPWIVVQSLRFRARNSAWRNVRFGFDGSVKGALAAFVGWPMLGGITLGLLMPLAFFKQQRFIVDHHRFGATAFRLELGPRPYYMLFVTLVGVVVAAMVVSVPMGSVSPILPALLLLPVYLVLFAWFTVRSVNLKYNNTRLDDHGFAASYALGSYMKLVALNTLGMVLTLGLFYPWAKVRTARYAAEHTELVGVGDLDGFVDQQSEQVSAIGQEVGDLFDVELGL